MGKINGENLWGKFMGKIYGENLCGKLMRKINVENFKSMAFDTMNGIVRENEGFNSKNWIKEGLAPPSWQMSMPDRKLSTSGHTAISIPSSYYICPGLPINTEIFINITNVNI